MNNKYLHKSPEIIEGNTEKKFEEKKTNLYKNFGVKIKDGLTKKVIGFLKSSKLNVTNAKPNEVKMPDFIFNKKARDVDHERGMDIAKYGTIGFPGIRDGQIVQYPEYTNNYYQWDEYINKWRDVSAIMSDICSNSNINWE